MLTHFFEKHFKNASLLTKYNVFYYKGKIILQYPRADQKGEIPEFVEEKRMKKLFQRLRSGGKR